MNNKLTKEQLLTALMIRLDQLESKIDKLLNSDLRIVTNITIEGDPDPGALIEQIKTKLGVSCEEDTSNPVTVILDSLQFDETYK